ncbi:unnamed protein product (macronuclear) [Paramecium tetraurelia]|uniref:RING-type domain-containing protein n=1 Tax=Paramecium tetraurelia TaxID=5888 RepID=A0CP51_PARTE|nr:uncharacterized protein GSPATT00008959001 [Paramecium tetraurelia]CAK72568.1 unnamed protein product [Paramecium tetraurelia]|eukprot:XP_001439965.1 hypothetical protein (macronuclear) [Paramecium tetraurelia strain d4-2]
MIILLLIQTCYSSSLFDNSTLNNITDLFTRCKMKGENQDNLLFQCSQMNAIIPKSQLNQDSVYAYSFNTTEDVQLSNMLLSELLIDPETLSYQIKLLVLYYSYYGNLLQMIQSLSINKYSFYNYQATAIDGTLNMIGLLMSHVNEHYITCYFIPIHPSRVNSFPLKAHNFTCTSTCVIKGFSQYYNKQRNSLIIVIAEEDILNILEYSFLDWQLRFVSQYQIAELIQKNDLILKTQQFEDYLLVELKTCQALFHISSILYEVQLLYLFSNSPLFVDQKSNLVFQKSYHQTLVYSIDNTPNWFTLKQVNFLQIIDVPFTNSIIVQDEKQFVFVYDNFRLLKVQLDRNENVNQQSNCPNTFTSFPHPNSQSLEYQFQFLDENWEQNKNNLEPLEELQNYTSCIKPCDLLYFNYDIQMVPYEQQCISSELYQQFTDYCSIQNSCLKCNNQIGCNWDNDACHKETQMYQIDLSSNEQSSKWYYGKIWKCEETQQQNTDVFCGYNQTEFSENKEFTYQGQIRKGQMCSWFYDANEFQQFNLFFKADLVNLPSFIQISICLGLSKNEICSQINFEPWDFNQTTTYPFKGYYFRYTIIFIEDNLANNISFSFSNSAPISMGDRLKQSLLQMLTWLCCGILLFCIMGYMAKRRLQYLVAQTIDNDLNQIAPYMQHQVPLNDDRLKTVMQNLIDQEIITKYPSDPSLLLYGEDSCAFCFDQFDVSQFVAQLFCGHVYHYDCFEDWIRIKGMLDKCPICNQKVDHFLANKEEYAIIKSQILDRINESEKHTTHLIE